MNVTPPHKIAALKESLESGLSIRRAAKAVGINRSTACRWARLVEWQKKPERVEKLTLNISKKAKMQFKSEAAKMHLSPTMFASLVLETIAEDDLFGAVLDS